MFNRRTHTVEHIDPVSFVLPASDPTVVRFGGYQGRQHYVYRVPTNQLANLLEDLHDCKMTVLTIAPSPDVSQWTVVVRHDAFNSGPRFIALERAERPTLSHDAEGYPVEVKA